MEMRQKRNYSPWSSLKRGRRLKYLNLGLLLFLLRPDCLVRSITPSSENLILNYSFRFLSRRFFFFFPYRFYLFTHFNWILFDLILNHLSPWLQCGEVDYRGHERRPPRSTDRNNALYTRLLGFFLTWGGWWFKKRKNICFLSFFLLSWLLGRNEI